MQWQLLIASPWRLQWHLQQEIDQLWLLITVLDLLDHCKPSHCARGTTDLYYLDFRYWLPYWTYWTIACPSHCARGTTDLYSDARDNLRILEYWNNALHNICNQTNSDIFLINHDKFFQYLSIHCTIQYISNHCTIQFLSNPCTIQYLIRIKVCIAQFNI